MLSLLPSPWHYSLPIWWTQTGSGQPWKLQSCVTATPSFSSCIFQPHSPFSCYGDSKCHWFLSSKSPEALKMDITKEKKTPFTLRATALHKTHPWVHCTPFMIYITISYQRSRSVKNVSWVWRSSGVFFLSLLDMGKDRKRVNANNNTVGGSVAHAADGLQTAVNYT